MVFCLYFRCSTYSECTRLGDTHWLPSVKNECLSIDLSIDLSRYAYKIEGKLLVHFTEFFKLYSRLTLSLYFNLISICWETFFLSTIAIWCQAKRGNKTNGETKKIKSILSTCFTREIEIVYCFSWLKPDSSVGRA